MSKFLVTARILIGIFFIVTSFSKIVEPYQNFLYVVQSYDFLSPPLEELTARIVPWVEFFLGIFLAFGLWLEWVLRTYMLLITSFLMLVGQALIRKLPITECGCFGELLSVPLHVVLMFDSCLWIIGGLMLLNMQKASRFCLDSYFKNE